MEVPFLLPHEILHSLAAAGDLQFAISMTGHRSKASIAAFWKHCRSLEEWKNHPCLEQVESHGSMLPLILHVDGAEFYSNSEYLVWSMSSVLSDSHVWDSKFPICILPHDSMGTHATKKHVHETVANLVAWSLRHAASGIGPDRGFRNEPLTGVRKQMAGKPLALGCKGCYFGFRFDEKARKEVNFFYRSYQHGLVCMRCMAQRMHKNWIPELPYKNMDENAAHRMTTVSFDDYLRSGSVSPRAAVQGWNLQTCFHDPMHNLFLGTCRDLYSSSLGFWCRNGFFGSGTLDDKLAQFSKQLKEACHQEKIGCSFKKFTAANTGLDTQSQFPELSSVYKAAFLKSSLWYFAKVSLGICEKFPDDLMLRLIALCHYHIYVAFYILDHCDLILSEDEAKEVGRSLHVHLLAWQHLAGQCEDLGLYLYKLRPKHHNVDHLGRDVSRTRLNPRKVMSCFSDESFLGYIKRIGVRCHQASMMGRLYSRYLLFLSLRWRDNQHQNR